jgi:hypothetical protein
MGRGKMQFARSHDVIDLNAAFSWALHRHLAPHSRMRPPSCGMTVVTQFNALKAVLETDLSNGCGCHLHGNSFIKNTPSD